ncbi:hypothetical protein [Klebsiella oxytoca]|uniref:hypothetical protein n=1 Tax=Klebsiella oxytoca TaxID=571 RepID=UPI001F1FE04A|nr:hypothetical protein [Klebsiella oxytoca]MCE5368486.1 hypothetical protein [Klebsiella oxytoca]
MMKVYRDKDGKVINIGEWDYMEEEILGEIVDEESKAVSLVKRTIRHNPVPEGATFTEEDVITLSDGGIGATE